MAAPYIIPLMGKETEMSGQVRCVKCRGWFSAEDMVGRVCEDCFNLTATANALKGRSAPLPRATLRRVAYSGIAFAKDDGLDPSDLSGNSITGRRIG